MWRRRRRRKQKSLIFVVELDATTTRRNGWIRCRWSHEDDDDEEQKEDGVNAWHLDCNNGAVVFAAAVAAWNGKVKAQTTGN